MRIQKTDIKAGFEKRLILLFDREPSLKKMFFEIFTYGTAYIVGGFFRDFLEGKKCSRDVDIIVDIYHDKLEKIIQKLDLCYTVNRHKGIKLSFYSIEVDIWSIENNWAFKNDLVKLNENDKLNSIAKGCFFNYDSPVINLNNFTFCTKYYTEFTEKKELDIMQKQLQYKLLNPSTEANILRAMYIRKICNASFTANTNDYIFSKLGALKDFYNDDFTRLMEVKKEYPKYESLTGKQIFKYISEIKAAALSKHLFIDL